MAEGSVGMIVVSDASPLIALHALGMIELARQYFGEIIVPEAVFAELRSLQSVGGENTERMIPGLIVRSVQNRSEVARLLDFLAPASPRPLRSLKNCTPMCF